METSGFDLGQSIDSHINSLAQQGPLTGSDEAELKAHLYDTTEGLQKQGLNTEEAFMIACKRMGNEDLLTEEYSKVNPSVSTNKIWAYLLIGANLFYSLPMLIFAFVRVFYKTVFNYFQYTDTAVLIVTVFHLLAIVLVWYIINNKNTLSAYIETKVKTNALGITFLSFLPFLILYFLQFPRNQFTSTLLVAFPLSRFNSGLVEFSGYLALIVIVAGVASLAFSVNKIEKLTPKLLFQKPSILFLVVFGVITELLASITRGIRIDNILIHALFFGAVYLGASYLVTYYNRHGTANKYLFIFSAFGIIIEVVVGSLADMDRGNTHYTVYFVSFMLISIIAGRVFGSIAGRKILSSDIG